MPHRLATKLELITSFKALLAAFMADYDVFQIESAKTYGKNEWREDLKALAILSSCLVTVINAGS